MRKAYTKPKIMFESFVTSTNIAAGCEETTDLESAEMNCNFRPNPRRPDWIIFSSEPQGCTSTPSESGYDELCYHTPEESYNLFTS